MGAPKEMYSCGGVVAQILYIHTVVAYLAVMGLKRRIGGSFGDVAANRKIWWLINPVCESVNFY